MKSLSEDKSTLTDRYQTTVPVSVRKALKLKKREQIKYEILSDGSVLLSKYQNERKDPVIGEFLDFLERDMGNNPQGLKVATEEIISQVDQLVGNIDVDLDKPLDEE